MSAARSDREPEEPTFRGFEPAVARFFDGLARHNTRDWFDAHRDEWRALVKSPMDALLAEAESRYGSGRVMRINRDVRFSADKSPYSTSSSLWAGTVGGVYLRVSSAGMEVGGGLYEPSRDQLARGRDTIDRRPKAAAELAGTLERLQRQGYEVAGPSLSTAPRGYPRDHPHIELLRLKHYAALRELPLEASLDDIRRGWSAVEPLIDWVGRFVGPAESWP